MAIHSFLDGVALAAALTVGGGLGTIIAVVVIVHRFSDGIGVVSFILASRMPSSTAYRWVLLVASAPVLGVLLGSLVTIPEEMLGAILGFFAGFFLYVGAAELLPEAHRRDSSRVVVAATLGGTLAIYCSRSGSGRSASTPTDRALSRRGPPRAHERSASPRARPPA